MFKTFLALITRYSFLYGLWLWVTPSITPLLVAARFNTIKIFVPITDDFV